MAIVTYPANLALGRSFTIEQRRYDMAEVSDVTGDTAIRNFGPARWAIGMVSPENVDLDKGAVWEALQLKLRGPQNHIAVYDPVKSKPRGSLRGAAVTLAANVAAGANTLALTGTIAAPNLLLNTESIGGRTLAGVSATTDAYTTPFGAAANILRVIEDSSNGSHSVAEVMPSLAASTVYTVSVYAASIDRFLTIEVLDRAGVFRQAKFDLVGGAVTFTSGGITASIGAAPTSPWYRCTVTFNTGSGGTTPAIKYFVTIPPAPGLTSYLGGGNSWVRFFGFQLEAGPGSAYTGLATLNPGDWLQLGAGLGTSQLVKVVEPWAGTGDVTFEPPLRKAYASGTAVTWDKPVAYYRRLPDARGASWKYVNGRAQTGFSLDLVEAFA